MKQMECRWNMKGTSDAVGMILQPSAVHSRAEESTCPRKRRSSTVSVDWSYRRLTLELTIQLAQGPERGQGLIRKDRMR